jgi:c-di-GMP-binding flagellar brake protein YcgR
MTDVYWQVRKKSYIGGAMESDKKGAERRRHERYELKEQVFITFRPEFNRIGWITDISKGGVALQFSAVQDYSELPENIHADIFGFPQGFNLPNVRCKLVYDIHDRGLGFIGTRRCGLAFDEMSGYLESKLDSILTQFADSTVL